MLQLKSARIRSFILDTFYVFVGLFIFQVLRENLPRQVSHAYLLLSTAFLFYYGIEHSTRQLYISFLFLGCLFILNNLYHDKDYFYYIYTVIIISLALLSYFYTKVSRFEHHKLNKFFVVLKEDYGWAIQKKNKVDEKIAFYNINVDIMSNIYNVSRGIIKSVNSKDLLDLSIEFLEKSFYDHGYFIFDYYTKDNRFTVIQHKFGIPDEFLFKFGIYLKTRLASNFFVENKTILVDKISLIKHGFYEFVDGNLKSLLFIPLITQDNYYKIAVVLFENIKPLKYINLEYFDILSKQMNLGFSKVRIYEEIQEQSIRDSLTNLYRRSFLEEKLEYEIKRSEREHSSIGILMIDVDYFKCYNDKYGHLVGDKVLVKVANCIKSAVYNTDIVARYGGEEFLVLMPMVDREKAIAKAEKIRMEIQNTHFFDNVNDNITISVGVSCYPSDGVDKNILIKKADKALYYAKNNGRNMVVDYLEVARVI
ncbi:MAG: GGDEF domain-containing protein [bacterium]|nr:GGDEF domain-containing protein [bacterium]